MNTRLLLLSCCACLEILGSLFAQSIQQKQLVVSTVVKSSKKVVIDTNGVITINCISYSDSLIFKQDRMLMGEIHSFSDSTLVLNTSYETVLIQYRTGKSDGFEYIKPTDSSEIHLDTISFSNINLLRFNTGRNRQLIRILQNTSFTAFTGNLLALLTILVTPDKYVVLGSTARLFAVTTYGFFTGIVSYFFYPKNYLLNNQPNGRKRIKWEIEVE